MKRTLQQATLIILGILLLLCTSCTEKNDDSSVSGKTCTVSIICTSVLTHKSDLLPEKEEIIPQNGYFTKEMTVVIGEEDTVFSVLQKLCRDRKMHLDFEFTPAYNSMFIKGIGNLYCGDCGAMSGWMFAVNKVLPSTSCDSTPVKDGDTVEWLFICDYATDLTAEYTWGE